MRLLSWPLQAILVGTLLACFAQPLCAQSDEDKKARAEFMKDTSREAEDARATLRAYKTQQDNEKEAREKAADKRVRDDAIRAYDQREAERISTGNYHGGELFWGITLSFLCGFVVAPLIFATGFTRSFPGAILVAVFVLAALGWWIWNATTGYNQTFSILRLAAFCAPNFYWAWQDFFDPSYREPSAAELEKFHQSRPEVVEEVAATGPAAVAEILQARARGAGHWTSLMAAAVALRTGEQGNWLSLVSNPEAWSAEPTMSKFERLQMVQLLKEVTAIKVNKTESIAIMKEALVAFGKTYSTPNDSSRKAYQILKSSLASGTLVARRKIETEITVLIAEIASENHEIGTTLTSLDEWYTVAIAKTYAQKQRKKVQSQHMP